MPERKARRIAIIRQVAVFQFKLLLDALRDLTLSPLSLIAAAADLLGLSPKQGLWFDRVLGLGRRSEHMIDLWRAGDRAGRGEVDAMVNRLEVLLKDEEARKQAPTKLRLWAESTLDQIRTHPAKAERFDPPPPPPPGSN